MSNRNAIRTLATAMTGVQGNDFGNVSALPSSGNSGDYATNTVIGAAYVNLAGTWTQVLGPVGAAGFRQTLSAATPSATLNTNGTAVTGAPDAGFNGINVDEVDLVYGSVGAETVTTTITATFSDGTTSSAVTDTSTSSTTHSLDITALQALRKTGLYVTGVSVVVQSSINSSTATVTPKITGAETR